MRQHTQNSLVKTLKSVIMCRRRLVVNFLIASLLLSMAVIGSSVQSSTTQLYVEPSKVEYWTPSLNEVFMVNASIANVTNLIGFELEMHWNTTLLDLIKVEICNFLNPPVTLITNETREDLGKYTLKQLSSGGPKDGSGSLVSLSFKITYEPTWPQNVSCALDLANTKLSDPLGDPISHNVVDGEYSCYSTPPLNITMATIKQSYYLLEANIIHGNLTYGATPVTSGLVAFQVNNPMGQPLVIRTLSTGAPPTNPLVEITNVFPCDSQGNPKTSFYKGNYAYFNVSGVNNDVNPRTVRLTVNAFDSENAPMGVGSIKSTFAGDSPFSTILQVYLSDGASLGNACVYAGALTELPSASGAAYCVEKLASFTVLGSSGSGLVRQPCSDPIPPRSYNFTLNLPLNGRKGNYVAYVGSLYQGQIDNASVMFEVKVPDVNGDNSVDIFDLVIVAAQFGRPPPPIDDPRADVNKDGVVDIFDLVLVAAYFGWFSS